MCALLIEVGKTGGIGSELETKEKNYIYIINIGRNKS